MKRNFTNFVELLQYRAENQSAKTVFTFLPDGENESLSLTYQQLDQQARAIASRLEALNGKGQRALLLYQPGLEFICAFFGCLYAGVIAVPAYPPRANRSLERLQAIVSDAQAHFALTTESLVSTIEGKLLEDKEHFLQCVVTDNLDLSLASQWHQPEIKTDNLAFLQYTSGSTGNPKGVMISHGNLIHNSALINHCFQDTSESRGVSWLPPYHDMGLIGGILQPIYVGAFMALMPPVTFLQRPIRWLEGISRYRVTTSGAPNFAYELCATQINPEQLENLDLSCWELAFTGAEPIRPQTLAQFAQTFSVCGFRKEAFYPCYGMAETTLIVSGGLKQAPPVIKSFSSQALTENRVIPIQAGESAQRRKDAKESVPSDELFSLSEADSISLVGCGKAVEDERIVIVNPDTLKICSEQEIGEIWVSSASVAQGYWNRQDLTNATFHAYIADTQEGPFLRTGDLGFLLDGELFVTGRLKDLIIIRGRNHYPQDIELTVEKSHPAIRESCGAAFAIDVAGQECLVITYEVKRSYIRKLNVEEVESAIRRAIVQNHELQPYSITLLKTGSIPKTSSGKIQRHACKAEFLAGKLNTVGEWRQEVIKNREDVVGRKFLHPSDGVSIPSHPASVSKESKEKVNKQLQASIADWLVAKIAEKLGIEPWEIDIKEPFASYGLDSLQAVRLSAELEDFLGRKFSPTLAYDYPTIESLSKYLSASESTESQPKADNWDGACAIIGIGCRFPGANNYEEFWQLLSSGKEAITKSNRPWLGDTWGGFLEKFDEFDAQFFGISPREAQEMDPQQRLLLEVTWEALENASVAPDKLAGSATGVFVGISSSDYSQIRLQTNLQPNAYVGTGNAHSIAANRISYLYNFRGPSLAVDTACSSSLVALHLAVKSLQSGECQQAIAGGVNLILSPELTATFTQAGMMASDGRCKTFDEKADGYVRSEGCGVVVLKRLEDAIKDGNPILAVVRGSAINQDGRSNGLTAPNGLAQQEVILQALHNARINPSDISYVETHGTGTVLGDPIEVNSLKTILLAGREAHQPLWLGSVKTNIGHLEAAAGIAGLIKAVLSLKYQYIPPHLNFHSLNPHIDFQDTPISIPTKLTPWQNNSHPRFAGVSSFGFGGTNAHVILQEYLPSIPPAPPSRPLHIFSLCAKRPSDLTALVKLYEDYLTNNHELSIEDICFTANTGRAQFKYRLAAIAGSTEELKDKLASDRIEGEIVPNLRERVVFLFTGQGSQYVNMGWELYQTQPIFRDALNNCAALLEPYLEKSLLEVIYPCLRQRAIGNGQEEIPLTAGTAVTDSSSLDEQGLMEKGLGKDFASDLDETIYTQPALFALEYALCQLWLSWGIEPKIVMGHSVGEYVAATVAGVFSLEDGLKLIAHRGRLMQALPSHGSMVAVFADASTVNGAIDTYNDRIAIAAYNSRESIVISGETQAIAEVVSKFSEQGIKTKQLKVSHGFHSPLMKPMLKEFEEVARQIKYETPRIPIVSNVTGDLIAEEIAHASYWVNHVLCAVKFAPSMEKLGSLGYQVFVEIGAKPTLIALGQSILSEQDKVVGRKGSYPDSNSRLWLPSLRKGKKDSRVILSSLAQLYVSGFDINWSNFASGCQPKLIWGLPTYPFNRQRYWIEQEQRGYSQSSILGRDSSSLRSNPVGAQAAASTRGEGWLYCVQWQLRDNKQVLTSHRRKPQPETAQVLAPNLNSQEIQSHWLIFSDASGVGDSLARRLEERGGSCLLVYPGDSYKEESPQKRFQECSNLLERCTPNSFIINPHCQEDFLRLFEQVKSITPSLTGIVHLWSLTENLPYPPNPPHQGGQGGWGLGGMGAGASTSVKGQGISMSQVGTVSETTKQVSQILAKAGASFSPLPGTKQPAPLLPREGAQMGYSCESVLYLLQSLSEHSLVSRLWIVTQGVVFLEETKDISLPAPREDSLSSSVPSIAGATLWGLGKVIALEYPEYWGGMIDLGDASNKKEITSLCKEISAPDGEEQIALREGKRYVARLCPLSPIPPFPPFKGGRGDNSPLASEGIRLEGSYLITGGLGAVGIKVAQWLVKQGGKNLVLIGRNEPEESAKSTIETLKQQGVNILVSRADVSNIEELSQVLEKIQATMAPLKGVIHCAGVLDDGLLHKMSWERFNRVLTPKVKGALNLHQLTLELPLDFFIMFSSAASLLGSPGQGNYAAANGFLDGLAQYRHSQGLKALSINWGALSVGMASKSRLSVNGLEIIDIESALEMLGRVINSGLPQVGIMSVQWETIAQQFSDLIHRPYFAQVIPLSNGEISPTPFKPASRGSTGDFEESPQKGSKQNDNPVFEQLLAMNITEREEFLTTYLKNLTAKVTQLPAEQISAGDSLLDLGMDSLMVMEALNQLKKELQLMLYPREFYERPQIETLGKYLAREFTKTHDKGRKDLHPSQGLLLPPQAPFPPLRGAGGMGGTALQGDSSLEGMEPPKKLPGIVFILSSPRSGSTLLRVMLAGHPELASPPELHLLPFNTMAQRQEELGLSHLEEGLQRALMELKDIDAQTSQALIQQLVKEDKSIPEVYQMLQNLVPNRLLVDKSPTYAISRETLQRAEIIFEGAKYIHLVRHPYSVIDSFCRLRMDKLVASGEENPYKLAESIWAQSNQNILDFAHQLEPNQYYQLRYEDLVTQTTEIMQDLCKFLGIAFDESVLKPYQGKRMTDGVYQESMSVGDPNFLSRGQVDGKLASVWREIKLPYPLEASTRHLAGKFNYELPHDVSWLSSQEGKEYPMEEEYLNVRGLNLCLCSWGSPEGELILCLHGILEQGAAWALVATILARAGYRVVAPDLRGHGKSAHVGAGGSYNLLDFLGDVDAIANNLGTRPLTLVGHSLGSVIGAMFASIRPEKVKNLLLVETVLPSEGGNTLEQLVTHLNYLSSPLQHSILPDVETAAQRLKVVTEGMSDALALSLAQRITIPCQGGVCWRWDVLLRTRAGIEFNGINRERYLSLLKQIQAPITLVYGDKSDFNRPEELKLQQETMSQANRIILRGGHNLHLEAPVELARIIQSSELRQEV